MRLPPVRRRGTVGAAFAVPLLLALVLGVAGGCGGSDSGGGIASATGDGGPGQATAGGTPVASDPAERGRQFARCMRDNGVDMPDPDPDGGGGLRALRNSGVDQATLQKALDACRELMPNGGQLASLNPAQQEQVRQWAVCMREHGADVPDPDPNQPGLGYTAGTLRRDDPKFQAAFEACRDKFVGPGGQGR